jgi:hypothetical protein
VKVKTKISAATSATQVRNNARITYPPGARFISDNKLTPRLVKIVMRRATNSLRLPSSVPRSAPALSMSKVALVSKRGRNVTAEQQGELSALVHSIMQRISSGRRKSKWGMGVV